MVHNATQLLSLYLLKCTDCLQFIMLHSCYCVVEICRDNVFTVYNATQLLSLCLLKCTEPMCYGS